MLPRQRNRNVLTTAAPEPIYAHARELERQYTQALETIGWQEQALKHQRTRNRVLEREVRALHKQLEILAVELYKLKEQK